MYAPEELQQLLEARLPRLRTCGTPLPTKSATSRAALDKRRVEYEGKTIEVTDTQLELCILISNRFDLDEIVSMVLLRTFLDSEHPAMDALATGAKDDAMDDFLDVFHVFFFEEQLAVVRCVSALLRISEDEQNELYSVAIAVLDQFADAAFATEALTWFEQTAARAMPHAVRNDSRYSLLWARQSLCLELALLEVVFLLYYGRLQPTAAFTYAVLASAQQTQFGQTQANAGFLDTSSWVLVECVAHLLLFLAIECLNLEAALDPLERGEDDVAIAPLVADPASLERALEVLENASSLACYAPLLLGWSLLLRRVDEMLEQTSAPLTALRETMAVHDHGAPIWRRMVHGAMDPGMDLFGVMHSLLASPLLGGAESAVLGASNLSALAYRAVFKGLLLSLTELIQPEYIPDFDALTRLYAAAFGTTNDTLPSPTEAAEGVASLCLQFWTADMPHPTRASVLTTARRRFPTSLRPLVELARALSGNTGMDTLRTSVPGNTAAEASAATLDYLAQLPTLALLLPSGASGLAPYEMVESSDTDTVQYVVRRAMPVAATHTNLPIGTRGTLISPLGSTPQVVLWQMPEPVSGWCILRDVLAAFVAPPTQRAYTSDEEVWERKSQQQLDALSPDCIPGDWEMAASIADVFVAVLSADPGLAVALLEHLEQEPSGRGLVDIALDMLRTALGARPIPARLVCAAYQLLCVLLPLSPNEVWQRVRSSNLLVGRGGQVPLLASHSALRASDRQERSALLEEEIQRRRFPGTLALLDLLLGLVAEAQQAQFADTSDLLTVKTHVLLRVMGWFADAIWPEYQTWSYAVPRERLEMARRCVRLWTMVYTDPCVGWADAHATAGAGPLLAWAETLLSAKGTSLYLRPLLNLIGSGHAQIQALYRAGQATDARLADGVTEASLVLAYLLLERHRSTHTEGHPLETLFFQHTYIAQAPSRAPRAFAGVVLQYIWAPVPASLAVAAARLTTAVCSAVSSGTPSLGSTYGLENAVGHLQGVLENTYSDETLRCAVWRLLSALADTQPALATLLLTGSHRSDAPEKEKNTVLQLAVDTMQAWSELWEIAPALLETALQFLGVAWGHRYEHPAVFAALQSDKALWQALGKLVERATEPSPPTPASADDGATHVHNAADAATVYAWHVATQARALHLFEMDTQQGKQPESMQVLTSLLQSSRFADTLCNAMVSTSEMPLAWEEHLSALVPAIPLATVRRAPRRDDFDAQRTYGPTYVLDLDIYTSKLLGVLPADEALRHDATVLLTSANLAWSMVDAQAMRSAAWTDCLAGNAARLVDKKGAAEAYVSAAQRLLQQALDVPCDTPPEVTVRRVRLIVILLAAAWSEQGEAPIAFVKVLPLLASLLEHAAYQLPERSALSLAIAELLLVAFAAAQRTSVTEVAVASALRLLTVRLLYALGQTVEAARIYLAYSAEADEAETGLAILVAAMQYAIALPQAASVWAHPLREARVLTSCIALLSQAPLAPNGQGHVQFLAPLLQFCATLAQEQAACELLAESGIVYALCSNALSRELEQGTLRAVLPTGDANPLHAYWLLALQIVVSMIETLADTPHAASISAQFVETDVEAMIQLYAAQLRRTWHFAPLAETSALLAPLDAAQLYEVRAVLRLYYAMWRVRVSTQASPIRDPAQIAERLPLGRDVLDRLPYVLQELAYLYTHPREVRTLLGIEEEPTSAPAQAVLDGMQDALREAILVALSLLWELGGVATVLVREVAEWPRLPALVEPTLHTAPPGPASLGTLLELASAMGDGARASKDKRPSACVAQAMVKAIALCATQAVVWVRAPRASPLSDAARAQVALAETEIASGLGRDVDAALRAARDVSGEDETELLGILANFSQQFLGVPRGE